MSNPNVNWHLSDPLDISRITSQPWFHNALRKPYSSSRFLPVLPSKFSLFLCLWALRCWPSPSTPQLGNLLLPVLQIQSHEALPFYLVCWNSDIRKVGEGVPIELTTFPHLHSPPSFYLIHSVSEARHSLSPVSCKVASLPSLQP